MAEDICFNINTYVEYIAPVKKMMQIIISKPCFLFIHLSSLQKLYIYKKRGQNYLYHNVTDHVC